MRRRLPYPIAAMVCATALAMFTGVASASGPLAPGKFVIAWTCGAPINATLVVTEPHAFFQAVGLGQPVAAYPGDQTGHHGIPVSFTDTLTDVTLGKVIGQDSGVTGNGHAHPGKPTTHCEATDVLPGVLAGDFFGDPLPPELVALDVSLGDVIKVDLTAEVILGP